MPPKAPSGPRASRITTVILVVALVIVVVTAGILGAIAVLMTRDPDSPLLGGRPPRTLAVPIHFAPVVETMAAPCPGKQAALDEAQTTCYLLDTAIKVTAVQEVEALADRGGATYSVRIAFPSAVRDKVADLVREQLTEQQAIAVLEVRGQAATVLAAPIVTQAMDGDSLSIAGFTKEQADKLVQRLLGSSAQPSITPGQPEASLPATTPPGLPQPGTTQPGVPQQGTVQPSTTQPGATTQPTTPPASQPAATSPGAQPVGATSAPAATRSALLAARDKRFPTCQEAITAGYGGPYTKGRHAEYAWYPDRDKDGVACDPQDVR